MTKSDNVNAIPGKVRDAFKLLYGGEIVRLGERDGAEYYLYQFPEGAITGFPQVVSYKNKAATPIEGMAAVKIVSSFLTED